MKKQNNNKVIVRQARTHFILLVLLLQAIPRFYGQRVAENSPDPESGGASMKEVISDWEGSGFLNMIEPENGLLLNEFEGVDRLFAVTEAIPIEVKQEHLHLGDFHFSFVEVENGYSVNKKTEFDTWVEEHIPELVVVWVNSQKKAQLFSYRDKAGSDEYLFDVLSRQLQLGRMEGKFSRFRNLPLRDALFSIFLTIAQSPESVQQLYLKNGFENAVDPTADDSSLLFATYSPQGTVEGGGAGGLNSSSLLMGVGAGLVLGSGLCFLFMWLRNQKNRKGEEEDQKAGNGGQNGKKKSEGNGKSGQGKGQLKGQGYFEKLRNIFLSVATVDEALDHIKDMFVSEKDVQNAIQNLPREGGTFVDGLIESEGSGSDLALKILERQGPRVGAHPGFDDFIGNFLGMVQLHKAVETGFPGYDPKALLEVGKVIQSEGLEKGLQDLFRALGLNERDNTGATRWIGYGTRVDAYQKDLLQIMQAQGDPTNGDYLWAVAEGLRMLDQLNHELAIDMGLPLEASGDRLIEFLLTGYAIRAISKGDEHQEIIPHLKQVFEELQPSQNSRRLGIEQEFWDGDIQKLIQTFQEYKGQAQESIELRRYFNHAQKRFSNVYQLLNDFRNPPSATDVGTLFQQTIQMAIHYNELAKVYSGTGTTAKERMNVDLILNDRRIADLSAKDYQMFSKLKDGGTKVTFRVFQLAQNFGVTNLDDVLIQGFYISPEALQSTS